jgi:spermidine synthase
VLGIGLALVVLGVGLGVRIQRMGPGKIALAGLATVALALLTVAQHHPCATETDYHCVQVISDPEHSGAKVLVLDRGFNSDVDVSNPSYLGFDYEKWVSGAIDGISRRAPLDGVFVGGGAFTLPRWLEATHPGSRSNVLEVDGQLVDFDRRELGLRTSAELRATVGDARLTMEREPSQSADVIVGDAFSSRTVPWQLMTTEWLKDVRRVLKPKGIYALNMIDFPPLRLLRSEAATLLPRFSHMRLITFAYPSGRIAGGNEVLISSNAPIPPQSVETEDHVYSFDRPAIVRLVGNEKPLRDDYAPVDQLETRPN